MRPLIVIPAYNEAQNIGVLLERLAKDCPGASVLIVDDSPGEESADIIRRDRDFERTVFLLRRRDSAGLPRRASPVSSGRWEKISTVAWKWMPISPTIPPMSHACSRP